MLLMLMLMLLKLLLLMLMYNYYQANAIRATAANATTVYDAAVAAVSALLVCLTWCCDWLRRLLVQQTVRFRRRGCGQKRGLSAGRGQTGWRGQYWCRNQWPQILLEQNQQQVQTDCRLKTVRV